MSDWGKLLGDTENIFVIALFALSSKSKLQLLKDAGYGAKSELTGQQM